MNILIVEDDFAYRRLLQRCLAGYGDCDVAINGIDAVDVFKVALDEGHPYDLICLDIMMPNMDGRQALKVIRQIESEHRINGLDGVKMIMTTALGNSKNVMGAFREGCEAYIVKPVEKDKLFQEMENLGLVPSVSK